jgi:membrane associated rhomboid family serine protease
VTPQPFWTVLAEFPVFVLRAFAYPRSLVRGMDWDKPETLQRLALYTVVWLALLVVAFSDHRQLSERERPQLSTFKGVVMRAHDASWDPATKGDNWDWLWLRPLYEPLNTTLPMAKRLWDTLLTTGFLSYTFLAGMLATALVARLRMWRFGLRWEYALGTGLLGYLTSASLAALSLVPLALLLICRHCGVRLALFVLLNLLAWAYLGYFTLADLGERPASQPAMALKSLAWGFVVFALTYGVFFLLVLPVLPA